MSIHIQSGSDEMKNPSSAVPLSEKVVQNNSKNSDQVTITERVNLTKDQYQVLNIICKTYEEPLSQYLQEALIEAMRFDIEEGNFSDILLDKLDEEDEKKKTSSSQPSSPKDQTEKLQRSKIS